MKRIFDEVSFEETAKALRRLNPCVARDFSSAPPLIEYMKNSVLDLWLL